MNSRPAEEPDRARSRSPHRERRGAGAGNVATAVFGARRSRGMGTLRAMDAKPWYEATDGRLPSWFASTATDVSTQVSDSEAMPAADLAGYLAVGESALKAIRLAQLAARVPDFQAILDLPCGHGRVLRWLRAAYPGASLTACDILADAVDFCRDAFGAKPVYSHRRIEASAFPESYDLIWVGSLFTHVDVPDWDHLLSLFDRLLRPDGVLVITTHGELVAERMRAGHLYGYPESGVTRALRAYAHAGFAFLEEAPASVDYGITLARPEWVLEWAARYADLQVAFYGEALWANHQDVLALVKRPRDPEVAHRPYT
jgi:SAM-dependent methyltransferase